MDETVALPVVSSRLCCGRCHPYHNLSVTPQQLDTHFLEITNVFRGFLWARHNGPGIFHGHCLEKSFGSCVCVCLSAERNQLTVWADDLPSEITPSLVKNDDKVPLIEITFHQFTEVDRYWHSFRAILRRLGGSGVNSILDWEIQGCKILVEMRG